MSHVSELIWQICDLLCFCLKIRDDCNAEAYNCELTCFNEVSTNLMTQCSHLKNSCLITSLINWSVAFEDRVDSVTHTIPGCLWGYIHYPVISVKTLWSAGQKVTGYKCVPRGAKLPPVFPSPRSKKCLQKIRLKQSLWPIYCLATRIYAWVAQNVDSPDTQSQRNQWKHYSGSYVPRCWIPGLLAGQSHLGSSCNDKSAMLVNHKNGFLS